VPVRRVRLGALGAAAGALIVARIWLALAPGRALRITADHGSFTGRGSRGSHGSSTGRGSRGSQIKPISSRVRDPRDPRPVNNPGDPRPVRDPRDPCPVNDPCNPRNRRPVNRDPRPVNDRWIRDLSRAVAFIGAHPRIAASCLEQGIALALLLAAAGIPAQLVVGVSRAEPTIRAHAWVECGGAVVLGAAGAQGLTPLLGTSPSASLALPASCRG
jgi:transglutaminase superfamily protein